MFIRNLFAQRESARKPRQGMCGAGRPSRFPKKEEELDSLTNDGNSVDDSSVKNDSSDNEEGFARDDLAQNSSRYDDNKLPMGEPGMYDYKGAETYNGSNQYPNQQKMMYPPHKNIPGSFTNQPGRYPDQPTIPFSQGPQAVPANVISTQYYQQAPPNHSSIPAVQIGQQQEQQHRQIHYQTQSSLLHDRQSSMMSDPSNTSYPSYSNQVPNQVQLMRQHPLPGTSQSYPVDQPLPVLKIDMSNMEPYQTKSISPVMNQARGPSMEASKPKSMYQMAPISVNSQQAFEDLPYDMQAALIKNMDNNYRTIVSPQTIQQAKMNPHVNAVMTADHEHRSVEALKAMAAQGGSSNYILADMQRQLQNQQMEEALRAYKEQDPNANVQLPMQFQHITAQQQSTQQQEQLYQNQQGQLQYQNGSQSQYNQQPQYTQQQREQQLVHQPDEGFSSQLSNGQCQQLVYSNNFGIMEPNGKELADAGTLNGGSISRRPLKVFTVLQRKKFADHSQGYDQNPVSPRDIHLFQLLPDPELLEIEAFLSVEECSHVIELANRTAGLAYEKIHQCVSILRLPETDRFISQLRSRAARCLDEPMINTMNPVIYKFDAAPKNSVTPDNTFPALEDSNQTARTLLVYLNGDVEGGELVMPNLGIAMLPKQGYALSWRSVNANGRYDPKTYYRNLPVRKGTLYCFTFYIKS